MLLRQYVFAAARHSRYHWGYAATNYVTLTLGLLCCICLLFVVDHETSYDEGFTEASRLFRVDYVLEPFGSDVLFARGPSAALSLLERVPGVNAATTLVPHLPVVVRDVEGRKLALEEVYIASPQFFEVFDFPIAGGTPRRALSEPGSIVLTHALALRLFGTSDAVGRTLQTLDGAALEVKAVLAAGPPRTHLPFTSLVPGSSHALDSWAGPVAATYVRLQTGAQPSGVAQALNSLIRDAAPGQKGELFEASLRPVTSIHLHSHLRDELAPNGNARAIAIFAAAALLILAMTVLNFANLTILHYLGRGREAGVRKTFGAQRRDLLGQFLSETIGLALAAGATAYALALVLRPLVFRMSGITTEPTGVSEIMVLGALILSVIIGIGAGAYPAWTLSSISPVVLFRSMRGKASVRMRRGFTVFQLVVTFSFFATAGTILHQLHYLSERDLGYEPDGLYALPIQGNVAQERFASLRQALLQTGLVEEVTYGSLPGESSGGKHLKDQTGERVLAHRLPIGPRYFETLKLTLVQGDTLATNSGGAEAGVFLNRYAARLFEIDHVDGATVEILGGPREVVGVIEDFHFHALTEPIAPVYAYIPDVVGPNLIIRTGSSVGGNEMQRVQELCDRYLPESAHPLLRVSDRLQAQYVSEQRLASLLGAFSLVAVVVAFLGLYAVHSSTLERRRKELGIRRVLGASFRDIYWRLTREAVLVCSCAAAVAAGILWMFWAWWNTQYAYPAAFPYALAIGGYLVALGFTLTLAWVRTRNAVAMPPSAEIARN